MKVNFLHVSDYALIDSTGKLSIIGIIQSISTASFPATHLSMFITFQVEAVGPEIGIEHQLKLEIADPDGTVVWSVSGTMIAQGKPAPGGRVTSGHAVRIPPVTFGREGTHGVTVFINGTPMASQVIELILNSTGPVS